MRRPLDGLLEYDRADRLSSCQVAGSAAEVSQRPVRRTRRSLSPEGSGFVEPIPDDSLHPPFVERQFAHWSSLASKIAGCFRLRQPRFAISDLRRAIFGCALQASLRGEHRRRDREILVFPCLFRHLMPPTVLCRCAAEHPFETISPSPNAPNGVSLNRLVIDANPAFGAVRSGRKERRAVQSMTLDGVEGNESYVHSVSGSGHSLLHKPSSSFSGGTNFRSRQGLCGQRSGWHEVTGLSAMVERQRNIDRPAHSRWRGLADSAGPTLQPCRLC